MFRNHHSSLDRHVQFAHLRNYSRQFNSAADDCHLFHHCHVHVLDVSGSHGDCARSSSQKRQEPHDAQMGKRIGLKCCRNVHVTP